MRTAANLTMTLLSLIITPIVSAQPPDERRSVDPPGLSTSNLAERMMRYDANKDGKLTQSEVNDDRLKRIFELADADKDGTVTRSELNVLMVRERANARDEAGGFGGPGSFQRRMGRGPGGGPPRGFGGPPQPGQILPPMLRQRLAITPQQEKEIDALQKEVDAKLEKLLSAEQRQQLKDMRERGPGGFGPPPGGGGPGGSGPPPPPGRGPGEFGRPPGGPPSGDDGPRPR
jgi:hypothetical protein